MIPKRVAARSGYDLPLATDPTGRFLAWIMALMVYLGVLSLAAALLISDMAGRWDGGLSGGLTVQIIPQSSPGARPAAERTAAALALLRASPGVLSADALPPEQTAKLVEPWLGDTGVAGDTDAALLPFPVLIDVKIAAGTDTAGLARRLKAAVPAASVDDHGAWLADLRRLARSLQTTALAVVGLVSLAGVMTVVFAVRAGLAIHRHVVQLLHLMGATDRYVARQFESHVLRLAARGGGTGLGAAVLTLLVFGWASGGLRATLLPDFTLALWQWAALAVLPLVLCLLAVVTARRTVLRTLEDLP